MDIIDKLKRSNIKLLETEAQDLAKWSKLKHNKQDLETFLQFNIAQVTYKNLVGVDKTIICTSDTNFVKIFSTKKDEDKKKLVKMKSNGIRTKDSHLVMTWDLVENKYKEIYLKSWQIDNFVSITPENILILDELANKLLKA